MEHEKTTVADIDFMAPLEPEVGRAGVKLGTRIVSRFKQSSSLVFLCFREEGGGRREAWGKEVESDWFSFCVLSFTGFVNKCLKWRTFLKGNLYIRRCVLQTLQEAENMISVVLICWVLKTCLHWVEWCVILLCTPASHRLIVSTYGHWHSLLWSFFLMGPMDSH